MAKCHLVAACLPAVIAPPYQSNRRYSARYPKTHINDSSHGSQADVIHREGQGWSRRVIFRINPLSLYSIFMATWI